MTRAIAATLLLGLVMTFQPPAEGSFGRGPAPGVVTMNGKDPAVQILVRPLVMLMRGDIRVEVRVPRHAENRILAISWTSDTGSLGSTMRGLDGEDAPVLHTLNLPGQPAANYVFLASVFDTHGKPRGRAEAHIHTPEER